MFVELPQKLLLITFGAFLFGWILSAINARLTAKHRARKRDPRDDRIRELEAELRISQNSDDGAKTSVEKLEDELKETTVGLERRDNVITNQQTKIENITRELKESVLKTRELRAELTERATENVHAEAKIREVQTELSVAQASTDLLATGVLDYDFVADSSNESNDDANLVASSKENSKAVQ